MTDELITGKLLRPDVVRTPRGRLSYAHVITPFRQEGPEGLSKLRYSTSLCFPKEADLTILQGIVEARAALRFGTDYKKKFPKLKLPFYQTSDFPAMGIDPDAFPTFIRTSSDASSGFPPPTVVDEGREPVKEDRAAMAYSGRWAILVVSTFAYPRTDAAGGHGNKGVSLGLQGVQLREDAERLGGGGSLAQDDFSPVPVSESADALFRGLDQQP